MNILGNIIWIVFGGFFIFLEYCVSGILLCVTIIGIPWGLQCFKLAILALWPFGQDVISTPSSNGCLSTFMNVLWILIGGIWICLSHLLFGLVFCVTIIGIPFGLQHFKLAALSLMPFGKQIVDKR